MIGLIKTRLLKFFVIAIMASGIMFSEGNAARLVGTACAPEEGSNKFILTTLDGAETPVNYCKELAESIGKVKAIGGNSGADMLFHYASVFFSQGLVYLSVIAVLVIVASGIEISLAGAHSEGVTNGKERIIKTLLSLVLLLMSNVILQSLNQQYYSVQNDYVQEIKMCKTGMPALPAVCSGPNGGLECSDNLPTTIEFKAVCEWYELNTCTVKYLQTHLVDNSFSVGSGTKDSDGKDIPDGLWGPTTKGSTKTCSTKAGCCPEVVAQ